MTVKIPGHWIHGEARQSRGGACFEDLNPLDDSVYALAPRGTPGDIDDAIAAAQAAFCGYQKTSPSDRESMLLRAADLLLERAAVLTDILIDEIGSPVSKARREVQTAARIFRAAAGTVRDLTGKTLPTDVSGRLSLTRRTPLGVVAGITPFNVPLIKNAKCAAMPLATGNTVVLLPSEEAPLLAVEFARLLTDAGFPDGALNVVTGSGYEIGDQLTTDPRVRFVAFTGSTRVGRRISEICGRQMKRCLLELGGKNPMVVLRDADLSKAVEAAVAGAFLYQGQICLACSRIYVEHEIFETFLREFCEQAQQLKVGCLREEGNVIGPVINERQRERIRQHISDAVTQGAVLHTGGMWQQNCCLPTVLTGVRSGMQMYGEETFGPVVSVEQVSNAAEALRRANDSCLGLSASVFTRDLSQAMIFVERLQAGMVHVNGTTVQEEPHAPFGGIGDSGFGRESTDAQYEYLTEWKWATVQYE